MGLFNKLRFGFASKSSKHRPDGSHKKQQNRICRFETMEERRMLDADPVVAGITYVENDGGADSTPDYFEVTFQGGAETTQLTQFVINGDQDQSGGHSTGDMYFDVAADGPGAGGSHGFQFDAANSVGLAASDILSVDVSDDGMQMIVNLRNFDAGDLLAFTIDVDEVEGFQDDEIASGVEFEGTRFSTTFVDQNYNFENKGISVEHTFPNGAVQNQGTGIFYDEYDSIVNAANGLTEAPLNLYADDQTGQADRSDASVDIYQLVPKPVTISGTVYHDENTDCNQDANDIGISGVSITLQRLNEQTAQYETVANTETDSDGNYEFGTEYQLMPGTYRLVEAQPQDYLSVGAKPGQVEGSPAVGSVLHNTAGEPNIISEILIAKGGQAAVNYDFCEVRSATLSGHVWHDQNDDGIRDPGEQPIANVMIQISRIGTLDNAEQDPFSSTDLITVFTDSQGYYFADMLPPGVYEIVEINNYPVDANPLVGFIDGKDSLGTGTSFSGFKTNDVFTAIELSAGQNGINFDFGELKPVVINGYVSVTPVTGECLDPSDPNHQGVSGVTIELYDGTGLVSTATTHANGFYEFVDLKPGTYRIVEIQPESLFDGDQSIGSAGGQSGNDTFSGVVLDSGESGLNYNFCEHPAAKISGKVWEDGPAFKTDDGSLPDGYRGQRDGVYNANSDQALEGVKMFLYFRQGSDNGPVMVPVTLDDVVGNHYQHLDGQPGNTAIWVLTNGNGDYLFDGLPAGMFMVLQEQPEGYADANDLVGTTTGNAYNSEAAAASASSMLTNSFSARQLMDSITGIRVQSGQISSHNDFTEVRSELDPTIDFPPPEGNPPPPFNPPTPPSPPAGPGLFLYRHQSPFQSTVIGGATGVEVGAGTGHTWHLSVINAGHPRGESLLAQDDSAVWIQASHLTEFLWSRDDMSDTIWTFAKTGRDGQIQIADEDENVISFGMLDGLPLAGDFNGDSIDEIAVFDKGYWYIDIDGNGKWTADDMIVKLGDVSDQPVVGDWDGDGKDDIGIYGPRWSHDREAIAREPGLPNPDNSAMVKPKNVPPAEGNAADGVRIMRLTSRGGTRADLIDHVFEYGDENDIAITGDWNGNGVRGIGVFRAGVWQLDVDGNGKFDQQDVKAEFGQTGDLPVVGDFNGDGIDEIGVYRDGQWIIDINNNREIDAADKVFEMGQAGELPVVGDWDGDGIDDPAIYEKDAG